MSSIPYGYVYRIVNRINGHTYIGQRKLSCDKSWRQYLGSGQRVKSAIAKYGEENFTKELLAWAYDVSELYRFEGLLISTEKSRGGAQYNIWTLERNKKRIAKVVRTAAKQKSNRVMSYLESHRDQIESWASDPEKALKPSAKKLGVHYGTLLKFVEKNQIEWIFTNLRLDAWREMKKHHQAIVEAAPQELITVKELAKKIGVTAQSLTRYIDHHEIRWTTNLTKIRAIAYREELLLTDSEVVKFIKTMATDETVSKQQALKQLQMPRCRVEALLDLHSIHWRYSRRADEDKKRANSSSPR